MVRFFFFFLCLTGLLQATPGRAADDPHMMDAQTYLRALGPAPSPKALYDFFDIYGSEFNACRQTGPCLEALSLMADRGEKGFVRTRLAALAGCPALPPEDALTVRLLAVKTGSPDPAPQQQSVPTRAKETEEKAVTRTTSAAQAAGRLSPFSTTPAQATEPMPARDAEPLPATTEAAAPPVSRPEPAKQTPPAGVTEPEKRPASRNPPATETAEKPAEAPAKPQATRPQPRRIPAPPPLVRTPLVEKSDLLPSRRLLPASPPPKPETTEAARPAMNMELSNFASYRDGDRGTSRFLLDATALSATVGEWKFTATGVYATSFSPKGTPETGSSWLSDRKESLLTEDVVFVPQVQYSSGPFLASLGSSPLGGTVDPLPTGKLKYSGKNLGVTLYHDGITDSLLAYVGFTDVYTGRDMGRVMRAGAKLEWQDTFAESWFYGGALSGGYLYGENVKENTAVKGEAYFGKSFGPFAVGLYASIDHFAYDLNHFTYGHGGYYSPYVAAAGAGFVSWEYKNDVFRFKADTSVGPLYEEIRDSSRYYGASGSGEDYQGGYNNKVTTNSGLEGALTVGENVNITGSARVLTSGKYFETRGGLGLKIDF